MTSINTDKYFEYAVPFHGNEKHSEDEFDATQDAKVNDYHERHKDKILDSFCDLHPSSPHCKVYDD